MATVEEAWAFLRDEPSDQRALRLAKAEWRSKGVVQAYRLVGAPAGLGIVVMGGTGEYANRAIRCGACAFDLGSIENGLLVGHDTDVEAEVGSLQSKHRAASPSCSRAAAVIGLESGTRNYPAKADLGRAIRTDLKRAGFTTRQATVRVEDSGLSLKVTTVIRDPAVSLASVEKVVMPFETIRHDASGDILSGLNVFVVVARPVEGGLTIAHD